MVQILYQKELIDDEEDAMEFATQNLYKGGSNEILERYNGLKLDDTGNITNKQFLNNIVNVLKKEKFNIVDENIFNESVDLGFNFPPLILLIIPTILWVISHILIEGIKLKKENELTI